MDCPGCGSCDLIKTGPKNGAQRYRCRVCGRHCTDRARKFSAEVKVRAVDMYVNNVGIRKIARFTGASPAGVLRWIRKAHAEIAARTAAKAVPCDMAPDIIEMDEIYTFVQKKPAAPSSGPPSAAV